MNFTVFFMSHLKIYVQVNLKGGMTMLGIKTYKDLQLEKEIIEDRI